MFFYTHFRDETTEAQRRRSHRPGQWVEPGLRLRSADSGARPLAVVRPPLVAVVQMESEVQGVPAQGHSVTGARTSTKSSDFKSRFILKIFKARNPQFGEKRDVQKEVTVLRYN